jgi:AcrR family transcriptional regulator
MGEPPAGDADGDRPASRRRGAHLESAIRAAVLELLVEQGVRGVTMAAVAVRAGTSKPVLYRRWPNRSALLRDALVTVATENIPHADTGSYRGDMLAILRGWATLFASPLGAIGPAIVGAMPHDPELAQAFQDGLIGWRKAEMAKTINRGIERGEVRPDVPVEIVRELGQAMLWHRFLVTGDPITEDLIVQIVDDVLVPYVAT